MTAVVSHERPDRMDRPALARPVVVDVSALFDPLGQAAGEGTLTRHLIGAGGKPAAVVRSDGRSVRSVGAPTPAAGEDDAAFRAVRAWLLGYDVRPADRIRRRPSWSALFGPHVRPAVPEGAIVLKPGLFGWDSLVFQQELARRRDLTPVGLVHPPLGLDLPEYASPPEVAALNRRLAALARWATALVVDSETARARMAAEMVVRGRFDMPIHVLPEPSRLAGTVATAFDRQIAEVPYVMVVGPIEARSNVLLLLNLWRDLIQGGEAVPKLVLAGERGPQIEAIKPMLDWAENLRPHVVEVAGLGPQHLRDLMVHARAVLAPDFWAESASLLGDAESLGVPIVAADIPVFRETLRDAVWLDPIDGLGWRDAVRTVTRGAPRISAPAPVWPGWDDYSASLSALRATL